MQFGRGKMVEGIGTNAGLFPGFPRRNLSSLFPLPSSLYSLLYISTASAPQLELVLIFSIRSFKG
jgi:hypothetical protein